MDGKFIALDIGNVCVAVDNLANVLDRTEAPERGKAEIQNLALDFELGVINEETFLLKVELALDFKRGKEWVYKIFRSVLKNEEPGMRDLIELALKKGYSVAFFSDTSPLHLREARHMLSFAHLIVGGVYSFEVGALKPDIKMLSAFESRYGKPALYIDDKENNCAAAAARGWNVNHFIGAQNLRTAIEKL